MRLLFTTVALVALLSTPALAQQSQVGDQNAGTAPASVGSNSASNANSNANQNLINGGSSANNGGVTVGPQTATSSSDSGAISGSVSESHGGNSTSDAHATGGTATTGASTSSATASPTASNAGNAQNITFNNVAPNKTKLETTPQVYAPALSTTLTETCMGSTSGGISVMGFGGTLGTTWNDAQCVRRLNAREMAQTLGDRAAARALMCQDKDVAAAYAAVGQDCRQKYEVAVVVPPPAPISPVVINNNIPAPPPAVMAPIPNPAPSIDSLTAPRSHKARPKNVPACKVDPHFSCPAHD